MLFKTGQAAGIFLKHKAKSVFGKVKESPKRKALFKKIKAKYKAGKLKTEYDQILSSGKTSAKNLKSKASKIGSSFYDKAGKHVMKNKNKYTAGAIGVSGIGLYSAAKNDNLGKLKKSDQRYKELKRKGFI